MSILHHRYPCTQRTLVATVRILVAILANLDQVLSRWSSRIFKIDLDPFQPASSDEATAERIFPCAGATTIGSRDEVIRQYSWSSGSSTKFSRGVRRVLRARDTTQGFQQRDLRGMMGHPISSLSLLVPFMSGGIQCLNLISNDELAKKGRQLS